MTKKTKAEKPRFLFLEDVPEELKLVLRSLKKDKIEFVHHAVDNKTSFATALDDFYPDLVIADFNLPSFSGMEALSMVKQSYPHIPFIFATGTLGEEKAVETLKQGAADFVLKTNLARLPMAVKRALREVYERKTKILAEQALYDMQERYSMLFENAPVGICEVGLDGRILSINKEASEILNVPVNSNSNKYLLKDKYQLKDILKIGKSNPLSNWLKGRVNGKSFNGCLQTLDKKKLLDITLIPNHDDHSSEKKLIGVVQDITERSRMENELRQKNILFENLLEAIPDLVYLKDGRGKYLMVNKAFERTFEKSTSEIIGKKDADFVSEPLASQATRNDQEVLKTKKLVQTTQHHKKDDGEMAIYDTRKKPILNQAGKVDLIVGISRDVTANVKDQEKLRHSEAMLLEAENVASIGSWELLVSVKKINCSIGAAKILRVNMSDRTLSQSALIKICHVDDRKMVTSMFKSAILDGESFIIDHRIVQGDGSIMWVQTKGKPHQNERGDIEKIVGTIQDITEQKRNQKKLEKSRELLRKAQSLARMGSFDWNITQNILHCSDEFYNILQMDQDGFWPTFENYLERIHPFDRELTRKKIFDALSKSERYDIEHRVLLPDNSINTVRAIGHFKSDEKNQPERLLGTIQDISEKKKVENALLEGQELERSRIAREIHDGIGQLLAATKFNLAALEGMPAEDVGSQLEKIHDTLEVTIDEARRITRNLSTKILEELGLKKAISELCNQALELKGLKIDLVYKPGQEMLGENVQTAMYRIVQESVNNMIKYSQATSGQIKLVKENNYMYLSITDNGKGFDVRDPKHKKGNGLANLAQRAHNLHGYCEIDSMPSKGTAIHIKIPFETSIKP